MKKKYFSGLLFLLVLLAAFLRLKNLTSSPPSPYWEEVALGYDAYSILETGSDHHGNAWPLVAFESFGDWKPSLYFYVLLPFIKVFGLNLLALRLPSVLAGLFLALGTAVFLNALSRELIKSKLALQLLFLLSFFLAAISPWAINFSRAAWESNLASALLIWGVNFFLIFINGKKKNWVLPLLSVLFLVLAAYTYHAARLIAPFLGLGLVAFYLYKARQKTDWRLLFLLAFLGLFLFLPLLKSLSSNVGQQRFLETSIFSDLSIIERSNQLRAANDNSLWSRIIYHRYLLFAKEIWLNFLDHFSFAYLFLKGDANPRHSIQTVGELYLLDLPFLILGIIFMIKNWSLNFAFLFYCLIIVIFPAALTKTTPHALRTLAAMPLFISVIALGIWQFLAFFKKRQFKKIAGGILFLAYLFNLTSFYQSLQLHYPQNYSSHWQYGYRQMVDLVSTNEANYEQIYITREQGRPAIYYWFYTKTDPKAVQAWQAVAKKDQGEFLDYQKIKFVSGVEEIGVEALVASSQEVFNLLAEKYALTRLGEVKDLSAKIVWIVYAIKEK